jgi:mono/diheme cytochrome c family protein/plastocyanin
MNTQKQITIMVTLVFALLAGCAAYTVYDQNRENTAVDAQAATLADRGARIFARYCRQCHGDSGQGRIGPQLNRADLQDPNTRQATVQWVTDTITCGRIGKIMPPWAITEGGALDTEQINDLVALITTNAGDGWKKAGDYSAIENQTAPEASVPDVLAGAVITGSTATRVCGQYASTPAPEASGPPAGVAAKAQWDETTTDNKFSTTDIVVPAGQPVTVNVTNSGQAMHNWDVLDSTGTTTLKDASGKGIVTNPQLLTPGANAAVTFTISTPGTYNFRCDVHPTEMVGHLFVVAGGGAAASPTPAP